MKSLQVPSLIVAVRFLFLRRAHSVLKTLHLNKGILSFGSSEFGVCSRCLQYSVMATSSR